MAARRPSAAEDRHAGRGHPQKKSCPVEEGHLDERDSPAAGRPFAGEDRPAGSGQPIKTYWAKESHSSEKVIPAERGPLTGKKDHAVDRANYADRGSFAAKDCPTRRGQAPKKSTFQRRVAYWKGVTMYRKNPLQGKMTPQGDIGLQTKANMQRNIYLLWEAALPKQVVLQRKAYLPSALQRKCMLGREFTLLRKHALQRENSLLRKFRWKRKSSVLKKFILGTDKAATLM